MLERGIAWTIVVFQDGAKDVRRGEELY